MPKRKAKKRIATKSSHAIVTANLTENLQQGATTSNPAIVPVNTAPPFHIPLEVLFITLQNKLDSLATNSHAPPSQQEKMQALAKNIKENILDDPKLSLEFKQFEETDNTRKFYP